MAVTGFNLGNFLSEFKGGSRPNQFYVDLVVPSALKGSIENSTLAEQKMRFMCRAAELPGSDIGVAPAAFRGGFFNLPGDRQFQPWTVTIYNDVDQLIRNVMEEWSDSIVGNVNRDTYGDADAPLDLMASGDVHQLDRNGEKLKSYKMIGIWPSNISPVPLAFDANDQIEEFQVTFQMQWWESDTTRNNTGADRFARSGGSSIIGV